ncbi:divalent-cation tolerance protein CutA [Serinicoccus sp. LYQ131]|uniref:divalent-cation tolerance protein CutA n=1 Tax=Serinicoccus sp. LYQ131 TaxID=3378797 RepID=UPI0038551A03
MIPGLPALVEARISVPDPDAAKRIADDLVARQLAACVQVLGPMVSVYTWRGEVHRNEEWLLLVKTTESAFPRVVEVVRAIHAYDVPEVVAVPVLHSTDGYADWVRENSRGLTDRDVPEG